MKKLSTKIPVPFLIICLIILLGGPLFSQKDDTVRLDNGDRITGEIKKVEYGIMNLKTSDMGTLYIEWTKIESIKSKKFFEIYLNDNTNILDKLIHPLLKAPGYNFCSECRELPIILI